MHRAFFAGVLCCALAACSTSKSAHNAANATPGHVTIEIPTAKPGQGVHSTPAPLLTPTGAPTLAPAPQPIPASLFTAALYGTVTQTGSPGQPIPGAEVIVGTTSPRTALTDSRGHYTIAYPAGYFAPVRVTKAGYTGQVATGWVDAHKSQRVDFTLQKLTAGKPVAPAPPIAFGQKPKKP